MNRIYLLIFVFALAGCQSMYESVDSKLFPPPVIDRSAEIRAWGREYGLDIKVTIQADDAEVAMWYLACMRGGEWDRYRSIPDTRFTDGWSFLTLENRDCTSKISVRVVAYNRWGKHTQKSDQMIWVIDIEELLAKMAAIKIED